MPCFQIPGDLKLSEDGRRLVWWQGAEEVAARVNVKLQVFKGIWFYDQSAGIRWLDIFDAKGKTAFVLLRSEVWRTIQSTNGIVRVQSVDVSFDRASRRATVKWSAVTDAGPTNSEVSFS